MHKLIDFVCDELDELEKKAERGKLSMSEVEYADKLAHLKKNLLRAEELMDGGYVGRSYRGNQRRDSRGRYADSMVRELRDMMNDSPDERTRQEFQRFINKMEQL